MIHSTHLPELRIAGRAVGIAIALLLVSLLLPGSLLSAGVASYLPLHTALEVAAISIAWMIAAIGLSAQRHWPSTRLTWLAVLFAGVGLLDLTHMLSFDGMPDVVTPSSPQKSIGFWLAARTLAAVALVGAALIPADARPSGRPASAPTLALALGLLPVVLVHAWFLLAPDHVPALYVPGWGLTPLKVGYEYVLIATCLLAAVLHASKLREPRRFNASALFAASVLMAAAEVFLTLYVTVNDLYNLLGHVYKIAAYVFLYQGLFVEAVRRPYQELDASRRRLIATIEALPDLLFEMDADGNYLDAHALEAGKLAAPVQGLLGRNLRDVMPARAAEAVLDAIRTAASRGVAHGTRITLDVPDGHRHFELSVASTEIAGERRFLVLSRDVSGIVAQERQLALESRLNALLLGLHDRAGGADERAFIAEGIAGAAGLTTSGIAFAFLLDDESGQAERVAWRSAEDPDRTQPETGFRGKPPTAARWTRAVVSGHPQVFEGGSTEDEPGLPSGHPPIVRMLVVPVPETGRTRLLIGVANKPEPYTERDLDALRILTDAIWQSIVRRRAETALAQKQHELDEFFSANLDLFCIGGLDGRLHRLNGAWESVTGYPVAELEGRRLLDFVHPEDRSAALDSLAVLASRQEVVELRNRWVRKDGGIRHIEWRVKAHGELVYAAARDVTQRIRQEASIRKLSSAIEQSPYPVVITDANACIEYVNAAFTQNSGYTLAEVLGRNPRMLGSGRTPAQAYAQMWSRLAAGEPWRGELVNRRKDGTEYAESILIYPVRDEAGRLAHFIAHKEDITERKAAAERIQELSHYDQLTGLPNRILLRERFAHALESARRRREPLALMYLDLDNFKAINDTLGQTAGDLLLREVARRLRSALRDHDTLSRQAGDDFWVVVPGADQDGAAQAAQRLLASLEGSVRLTGHDLIVGCSIGIATYPGDGETLEALQMCAETAMYRVKEEGRNGFRFYAPEMQAHSARTLALSSALKHALARNELRLVYQPQVSLVTGRITGAEALLRWTSPEWGAVSPAELVPLAERNGLIVPIGEWVLRTAATQLARWHASGLDGLSVAVNLSAVQFAQPDLAGRMQAIVSATGVDPGLVELELTEAVALRSPDAAVETMAALSRAGFRLSIDDFGTGYSSMSYLKRFRLDRLKIDRSFVRELDTNGEDQAIVTAIIGMAHSLGLTTIAEGVETEAQREFLLRQGCDDLQGYLCSPPIEPDAFEALVRAQGPEPAGAASDRRASG